MLFYNEIYIADKSDKSDKSCSIEKSASSDKNVEAEDKSDKSDNTNVTKKTEEIFLAGWFVPKWQVGRTVEASGDDVLVAGCREVVRRVRMVHITRPLST